jgi:hypothetical protein
MAQRYSLARNLAIVTHWRHGPSAQPHEDGQRFDRRRLYGIQKVKSGFSTTFKSRWNAAGGTLQPDEQRTFPLVMRYLVTLSQGEEEVPNRRTVPYNDFVASGETGRGIGAAIAKRLAAEGAALAFTYSLAKDKAGEVVSAIEKAGSKALAS